MGIFDQPVVGSEQSGPSIGPDPSPIPLWLRQAVTPRDGPEGIGPALTAILEGLSNAGSIGNISPAGAEAGLLAMLTRGRLGKAALAAEDMAWIGNYGKFNSHSTEQLASQMLEMEAKGDRRSTLLAGEYLREILERAVYDGDPLARNITKFSGEQDDLGQMLNRISALDHDLARNGVIPNVPKTSTIASSGAKLPTEAEVRSSASGLRQSELGAMKEKLRPRLNTAQDTQNESIRAIEQFFSDLFSKKKP